MHKTTKAGVILNTIIIVLTGNGLTTKLNYRHMQFSDSIFILMPNLVNLLAVLSHFNGLLHN